MNRADTGQRRFSMPTPLPPLTTQRFHRQTPRSIALEEMLQQMLHRDHLIEYRNGLARAHC
jgi:hypothetical protein